VFIVCFFNFTFTISSTYKTLHGENTKILTFGFFLNLPRVVLVKHLIPGKSRVRRFIVHFWPTSFESKNVKSSAFYFIVTSVYQTQRLSYEKNARAFNMTVNEQR